MSVIGFDSFNGKAFRDEAVAALRQIPYILFWINLFPDGFVKCFKFKACKSDYFLKVLFLAPKT